MAGLSATMLLFSTYQRSVGSAGELQYGYPVDVQPLRNARAIVTYAVTVVCPLLQAVDRIADITLRWTGRGCCVGADEGYIRAELVADFYLGTRGRIVSEDAEACSLEGELHACPRLSC